MMNSDLTSKFKICSRIWNQDLVTGLNLQTETYFLHFVQILLFYNYNYKDIILLKVYFETLGIHTPPSKCADHSLNHEYILCLLFNLLSTQPINTNLRQSVKFSDRISFTLYH